MLIDWEISSQLKSVSNWWNGATHISSKRYILKNMIVNQTVGTDLL